MYIYWCCYKKPTSELVHMSCPKDKVNCQSMFVQGESSSVHEVGWMSTLRPEHIPWSRYCFPVSPNKRFVVNGPQIMLLPWQLWKLPPNLPNSTTVEVIASDKCYIKALLQEGKAFRHFSIQIGISKILTLPSEDSWPIFPGLLWLCVHLFRIFQVTKIINAWDIQPNWFPCVHHIYIYIYIYYNSIVMNQKICILRPKWAFSPFAKTFQQNTPVLKLSSKIPLF